MGVDYEGNHPKGTTIFPIKGGPKLAKADRYGYRGPQLHLFQGGVTPVAQWFSAFLGVKEVLGAHLVGGADFNFKRLKGDVEKTLWLLWLRPKNK